MSSCVFKLENGMVVTVGKLNENNIPDIWQIEKKNFGDPWSMSSFKELLDAEFVISLGAFDQNGEVAGYIFCSFVVDVGEILNIAVDEKYKKQGIASLLMSSAHKIIEDKGGIECYLEVRESNLPAKNLYLKWGYEPIGVRKNYYTNPKENAVVMIKKFNHT